MGIVIQTYVNLKIEKNPSFKELKKVIQDMISDDLVNTEKVALLNSFEAVFPTNIYPLDSPKEKYQVVYEGDSISQLLLEIEKKYAKENICIYFDSFHYSLKDKFELENSYLCPVLFFIFKAPVKIEFAEASTLDKDSQSPYPEEKEIFELSKSSIMLLSASKGGPSLYDIEGSKFGKYFVKNFNAEIASEYW